MRARGVESAFSPQVAVYIRQISAGEREEFATRQIAADFQSRDGAPCASGNDAASRLSSPLLLKFALAALVFAR